MNQSVLIIGTFAVLIGLCLGCEKRPKTGTDLGPETNWTEVNNQLSQALTGIDRPNIKKGEKALFHRAIYVATAPRTVLSSNEKTGFDRVEDDDYLRIDMTQETQFYGSQQPGGNVLQQFIWYFSKHPEPNEEPENAASNVKFHKFQVSTNEIDPPNSVKATADCRKTPNCRLQTTNISFDRVIWSGDSFERVRFDFTFSPTVPALANPIRSCQSGVFMIKTQEGSSTKTPVFVHFCSELMDYIYASTSTPPAPPLANTPPAPNSDALIPAAEQAWIENALLHKGATPKVLQQLSLEQLYTPIPAAFALKSLKQ